VFAAGLSLQPAFGIVFAWGVVVPLVRAQEHWPPLLLGAVFAATPAGYGIGTAAGGSLADRLSPRRLCWTSLGLLAAGFGLAFLAPSGLTFVVAYAFLALGVGGGVGMAGGVAAMARVLPSAQGSVGGIGSAVYASAAVFQAPLIGALAPHLGWLGALRTAGSGMAILAAGLLTLMPSLPAAGVGTPEGSYAGLLRSRAIWRGFLVALCASPFGAYAALNLGTVLGAASVALFGAGNALGRLAAGIAADRVGVTRVMLSVLLVELFAALALFSRIGPTVGLVAALAAGLALGGTAGSLARAGADAAPERPNAAFGLVFTGFTGGSLLGPLAGAMIELPDAWLIMATPAVVGLALLLAFSGDRTAGPGQGSER